MYASDTEAVVIDFSTIHADKAIARQACRIIIRSSTEESCDVRTSRCRLGTPV